MRRFQGKKRGLSGLEGVTNSWPGYILNKIDSKGHPQRIPKGIKTYSVDFIQDVELSGKNEFKKSSLSGDGLCKRI